MAGSGSKIKGNSFERELAKTLSSVLGGNFMRIPNSGAYTGGTNAARKTIMSETQVFLSKGDLIPPDHMPKLVVEAKFYKDFRFHQLIIPGGCTLLDGWVGQALEAIDPGDFWFVAFKINLRGTFAAVPEAECGPFHFGSHANYAGRHGVLRVCDLGDFLVRNRGALLARCA